MEHLLISACLLGTNCKYNGGNNCMPDALIRSLQDKYVLVPVCPECLGGLSTPRNPSERGGERVISNVGTDVTAQFRKGAESALETAMREECRSAVLKERSPSCGCGTIYDGTFTGTVIEGDGVTAELLKRYGIRIYNENQVEQLL